MENLVICASDSGECFCHLGHAGIYQFDNTSCGILLVGTQKLFLGAPGKKERNTTKITWTHGVAS